MEAIEQYTVKELKYELNTRGLSVEGNKKELYARLKMATHLEITETKKISVSLSELTNLLSEFNGNNFTLWKTQIENIQKIYAVDAEELKILVIGKLRGRAIEWFHANPQNILLNLNELLQALGSMFHTRSSRLEIKRKLDARKWKPNEDFTSYYYDKIILANQLMLSEDEKIEYLVDGISNIFLKQQAILQQYQSTEALFNAFRHVSLADFVPATSEKKKEKSSGEARGSSVEPLCYNCGERGHMASLCKAVKKPAGSCFHCHAPDHKRQNCPKLYAAGREKEDKTINVIREVRVSNCKLDVKILLNDNNDNFIWKTCNAIVDTGSAICAIKKTLVSDLDIKTIVNQKKYFGINNSELLPLGQINTFVEIDNKILKVELLVVEDNTMHNDVILGINLFKQTSTCLVVTNDTDDFETEILNIEMDVDTKKNLEIGSNEKEISLMLKNYEEKIKNIDKPETEYEMTITLDTNEHFFCAPRRLAYTEREKLLEILNKLLDEGVIRISKSPYCSPIVLVKKKNGDYRLCIDYRTINKHTHKENYPLPIIEELIDRLEGKKYFTLMDLKSGFHQIKMAPDSCKFTSFTTPFGQFEYVKMPFGLKNAPSVFQRFVELVFRNLILEGKVVIYIDDILIATETRNEHLEILECVLDTLSDNLLELNIAKCKFLVSEIEFLGYKITKDGIQPNAMNLKAVEEFPLPRNVREVQRFLGLCSYFRKFVMGFTLLARPLLDLVKNNKFIFEREQLEAFEKLKAKLLERPTLAIFSPEDITELHCDGSAIGYGAILLQKKKDAKYHPIFYFSRKTTESEAKFHSYELETLAIIYALRRFRVYLLGRSFKIITDCNALTLTLNKQVINPRIARWALEMQEFDYTIEHRGGKRMQHVDALSRCNPVLILQESSFEQQLAICQSLDSNLEKLRKELELSEHPLYEMRDGLIYRKINKDKIRFYLPEAMITQICRASHDTIGHVGSDKTYEIIARSYWFPRMRERVKMYVQHCPKCISFNPPSGRKEGFLYPIPKGTTPFDTIHIDFLGPLEQTSRKKKHILVIIDGFTKYVKLYATKTTTSQEAVGSLRKYFAQFSRPVRLVSDRGSCFTSVQFKDFMEDNSIHHILVASGCPRANGQVERVNRVLIPMLSKLVEPGKQWDQLLEETEFALNNTLHKSINTTPSILLYGVNQRGNVNDRISEFLQNYIIENDDERDLTTLREIASVKMEESQIYNRDKFNEKRKKAREYVEGELVMISNVDTTGGVSKKLIPKYKGPYKIEKVLGHDRYLIKDVEGFSITQKPMVGVYEAGRIKPAYFQPNTDKELETDSNI